MHLAISLLIVLAVMAIVILPGPLAGWVINRRRRRRAEQPLTLQPTASDGAADPLPPHLLAALRVEGFLNEEEYAEAQQAAREAQQAAMAAADLDKIQEVTMLRIGGVIDSAVDRLAGGPSWVQLGRPES